MGELAKEQQRSYNGNICMKCAVMADKCCWLHDKKPVKGWHAKEKIIMVGDRPVKSYQVKYCPNYCEKPRVSLLKVKY